MYRLRGVLALEHGVGFGEARVEVAVLELDVKRDIARLAGVAVLGKEGRDRPCREPLVEERSVVLQRLVEGQDGGQQFVIDLDVGQGLLGLVGAVGGDGGDGVAGGEGLLSGHDVLGEHPRAAANLGVVNGLVFQDGEVGGGDDGANAGKGLRFTRVDGPDARVRVRAAEHLAVDEAGHGDVGAVAGAPGDLVHAVVPDRACAYDAEIGLRRFGDGGHGSSLRVVLARPAPGLAA